MFKTQFIQSAVEDYKQFTEEFLQELQSNKILPEKYNLILNAFLTHCDLVKFSKLKSKKTKEKDPKQKITFQIDFIMQLKDQKAANEELLLSKEVKNHFEKFKKRC